MKTIEDFIKEAEEAPERRSQLKEVVTLYFRAVQRQGQQALRENPELSNEEGWREGMQRMSERTNESITEEIRGMYNNEPGQESG